MDVLRPGLAASWRLDANGRTWIVTLRENARFSDGTPVTAADVRASWTRDGIGGELRPHVSRLVQSIVRCRRPSPCDHAAESTRRRAAGARASRSGHRQVGRRFAVAARNAIRSDRTRDHSPGAAGCDGDHRRSRQSAAHPVSRSLPATRGISWTRALTCCSHGIPRRSTTQRRCRNFSPCRWHGSEPTCSSHPGARARHPRCPRTRGRFSPTMRFEERRGGRAARSGGRRCRRTARSLRLRRETNPHPRRESCTTQATARRAIWPSALWAWSVRRARPRRRSSTRSFPTVRGGRTSVPPGLTGEALARARRLGTDAGYVMSVDSRPLDPCRDLQALMDGARWLDPETIVPLVETRLQAIVRRGRSGVTAEWDGGLVIAGVNDPR